LPALELEPIGVIHTPYQQTEGMPIQPAGAAGVNGTIEVLADYTEGLKDLDSFSHIILLYHFHQSKGYDLTVVPFLDDQPHGLFATRAPRRPNPIGLSIVRLNYITGSTLHISNIDVLDGTPLLDIKPYVPAFDQQNDARSGWIEDTGNRVADYSADDRFK
jgi:tRNA-Thr(GGU) m(6)t(6)A37 methyltransferase TsaA